MALTTHSLKKFVLILILLKFFNKYLLFINNNYSDKLSNFIIKNSIQTSCLNMIVDDIHLSFCLLSIVVYY